MPATRRERLRLLDVKREGKMAASPHAFVRGSTQIFYDLLAASPVAARLPAGPPVWICGDCHLGNLGPLADGHGELAVQIRDLDQTVVGNPALDLIRLGLSLASAARGSDLPGVVTARMVEAMVEGYAYALADPGAEPGDSAPEPLAIRAVRRHALGRRWRHLARERIEDEEPVFPLGKRFWEIAPRERDALRTLVTDPALAATVLAVEPGEAPRVRLADAAYWVKGCSSLGLARYAAVVAIKGADHEKYALIDIKQAVAPIPPAGGAAEMPADDGERVVAGARALSPNLGERMAAARLLGRSFYVRELMPQDLKLEVGQFTRAEAPRAARYLAFVVGKAHARQLDAGARSRWRAAMMRTPGDLAAPSWLWEAVVELAAAHEAAYLDHCRSYALADPR